MRIPTLLSFIVIASFAGIPVAPQMHAAEPMNSRDVVVRYHDLINQGDWKRAAESFAPDVRHHRGHWQTDNEALVVGKQALTDNLEDIFRTFPDWKMEIVDINVDGDSVVVRCRVSGTHRGVGQKATNGGFLKGVAPTGKHFVVQHIHWYKVREGQIVDHAAARDDLGMTEQLGLLRLP